MAPPVKVEDELRQLTLTTCRLSGELRALAEQVRQLEEALSRLARREAAGRENNGP